MSVYEAFAKTDVVIPLEHAQSLRLRRATISHPLVWLDAALAMIVTVMALMWVDPTPSLATTVALAWPLACAVAGAYAGLSLHQSAPWPTIRPVAVVTVTILALVAVLSYASDEVIEGDTLRATLPALVVGSILARLALAVGMRCSGAGQRRIILVGDEVGVREAAARMAKKTSPQTVVAAVVDAATSEDPLLDQGAPLLQGLDCLVNVVDLVRADTVIMVGNALSPRAAQELAWGLESRQVDVAVLPNLVDTSGPRLHAQVHHGMPLLWVRQPVREGVSATLKHGVDRVLAVAILVIIAPVFAAIAAAVRISSHGPAMFSQTRVGKNGQPFTLYKFRTMVVDAEAQRDILLASNEADGPLFKLREDPRVTPLGRFLRKHSLDELPQLINVVKGEMSLVGPRPPLPVEVAAYDEHTRRRLLVRPGLTGLWQVSGRSDLTWDEAVRLDLSYVDNLSLTYDADIVRRTVSTVLRGSGAY